MTWDLRQSFKLQIVTPFIQCKLSVCARKMETFGIFYFSEMISNVLAIFQAFQRISWHPGDWKRKMDMTLNLTGMKSCSIFIPRFPRSTLTEATKTEREARAQWASTDTETRTRPWEVRQLSLDSIRNQHSAQCLVYPIGITCLKILSAKEN